MREIRTQNWGESLILAPRHQIKYRASHENPVLAVLSTFLGLPPVQTPGRSPSGLVTGHEGCTAGELCLCESLCRKAGLVPTDFNRSRSLSNPWSTLRAEGKHLLLKLPQVWQAIASVLHRGGAEGLLLDLQIPEDRSKSIQSFPFYTYDSQAFSSYISFAFPQSWVIVLYLI